MRLVGYVRVSDVRENADNQSFAVLMWAGKHGHEVVEIVSDVGVSGAVPPSERQGWKRALDLLDSVDGVVVYALDRVARSLYDLSITVKEIESRGKVLLSVREEWLQSVDPKIRQLIISVLGWAGEMEREFIKTRTREALARLKSEGKKLGRPPVWNEQTKKQLIDLVRKGVQLKEASKLLKVSYRTAQRYLAKDVEYIKARAEARIRALHQI